MPVCPHCQTRASDPYVPCPNDDGFFCIPDRDFKSFQGEPLLGACVANRYVINGIIGHGSIGRVYRARQLGIDRGVVLKIFKIEQIVDQRYEFTPSQTLIQAREDAQKRFIREAQVLGSLTHPNCVTLYDFGVSSDGSFLYIAMEHVVGSSLRQALQRGLKTEPMLDIMRQILMALREAHSVGIVHRDLKPENILLNFRPESGEPMVKVLDFGIAKLVGRELFSGTQTDMGMLFGTPAYMSPEQCRGATDEISPASDIYSIGCLFFEMVTGKLAFMADAPHKLILLHQDGPIPEVIPRETLYLPAGIGPFIQKCLSKDRRARFSDARAALRVLDELIEEQRRERLQSQGSQASSLSQNLRASDSYASLPSLGISPDTHDDTPDEQDEPFTPPEAMETTVGAGSRSLPKGVSSDSVTQRSQLEAQSNAEFTTTLIVIIAFFTLVTFATLLFVVFYIYL